MAQDVAQAKRVGRFRDAVALRCAELRHRAGDRGELRQSHLANPQATEPQLRSVYQGFGLNDRQITIIANAQPKRDYYYQSRLGNRLFELDLGPMALAFAASGRPEDQRAIDRVLDRSPGPVFVEGWLRERGLGWAASLASSSSLDSETAKGHQP